MTLADRIVQAAATLVAPHTNLLSQRHPLTYVAAGVFVLVFAIGLRLARRRRFSPRAVSRLVFRRSVWLHRSSLLDYRMYVVNMVVLAFAAGYFVIGTQVWTDAASEALAAAFGPPAAASEGHWGEVAATALLLLVATDLGYWLAHVAMHRTPLLWEFHKVHHSAEVMTPATEFRQHPVELVLFPTVIGATTGLVYALAGHWWGGVDAIGHAGFVTVIAAHLFTFHHLRHSHIAMIFPDWLGRLLHSPAHHLVHHSADPAHADRNLGYILSVWDWAAGTLVLPRRGEQLTLGIGAEGASHDTVVNCFVLPFRNAARLLIPRRVAG